MTREDAEVIAQEMAEKLQQPMPRLSFADEDHVGNPIDCFSSGTLRISPLALEEMSDEEIRFGIAYEMASSSSALSRRFAYGAFLPALVVAYFAGRGVAQFLPSPLGLVAGILVAIVAWFVTLVVGTFIFMGRSRVAEETSALRAAGNVEAAIQYLRDRFHFRYDGYAKVSRSRSSAYMRETEARLRKHARRIGLEA